jgi:hypothetical protein
MARAHLVNVAVTRWYHCITRCVRRAFLLGECRGKLDRKQWIEQRLQELSEIFAVSVGGFSVMDNHLHVLVRRRIDLALPDRRPRRARFVASRNARGHPAGAVSASGRSPGRLFREGKAAISVELAGIFQRLGSSADRWQARLEKLKAGRLLGQFFAGTRARLREAALALDVRHLANLDGCTAG